MGRQYSIFDIANWFLSKEPMNHKKLQKLCYYAVAWGYALLDRSIVKEDEACFEAWVHGPVSPILYQKYKGNPYWIILEPDQDYINEFDYEIEDHLESTWLTYKDDTGNSLEALSHIELPWKNARKGLDPFINSNNMISIEDMKEYYRSIYTGGEE
jgi:uncharacterized phage-associated protein